MDEWKGQAQGAFGQRNEDRWLLNQLNNFRIHSAECSKTFDTNRLEPQRGELTQPRVQTLG